MIKHYPTLLRAALAAIATAGALTAPSALAGVAEVRSRDGEVAVFEYNDSMLRINSGQEGGYALVRDGALYTVFEEDGRTMVIDAGSMMKGLGDVAPQALQSDLSARVIELEKTGRRETVAGIKGEVYELQIENSEGERETIEMVLSGDRRAREFRDALFLMMGVAMEMTSQAADEPGRDMQQRLEKLNKGVLRYGDEMVLASIDGKRVDDARFELPAEPMNMEGLGNMLGGMVKQADEAAADDAGEPGEDTAKKGGLFSSMMGALGGQADRQAERAGDTVEEEIEEETDEKVDNAIGKALGKLFGR